MQAVCQQGRACRCRLALHRAGARHTVGRSCVRARSICCGPRRSRYRVWPRHSWMKSGRRAVAWIRMPP